ncbi:MAG: proline dehydrogenase family protein [Candidatus Sericytochromatia bacterium]
MDPKLIKVLPNPFIKFFAKPYIGGDSEDKVIKKSEEIYLEKKYLSTLDALGEDVKSSKDINVFVNLYLEIARKISKLSAFPDSYTQPSISLKPSCFIVVEKNPDGTLNNKKMDWEGCYENIHKICSYAKEHNVRVTVEMEDHQWTDFTMNTYLKLLDAGLDNVGTVLQTRLFRSRNDLDKFDSRARVRLVIGIYNEPSSLALTDKKQMKDLMLEYAKKLFDKGAFVEFASHDEHYIKRFIEEVIIPNNIEPTRYEIQMLLGVPKEKLQEDLMSGEYLKRLLNGKSTNISNAKINFRLYLPFALSWDNALAYCRRRLIENPNIAVYGLKHMIFK